MRLHDKIYLKSNRYEKPKEYFKFLQTILNKKISKKKNYNVIDIGCANGELIYYLSKNNKNFKFTGVDIREDLLKRAKKKLSKDIKFKKLNFNSNINFKKKFDIVICSGVISIFDDLKNFFNNLKKIQKKDTKFYFFGKYNEIPYDIILKVIDTNKKEKIFQSGWNIWSLKTLKKFFKNKNFKKHYFFIKKDLKKDKKDLLRSWTIMINKKRYAMNATGVLLNQMWLEIY